MSASISRIQVALSDPAMGLGVATHYFNTGSSCQPALKTFWTSLAAKMAGQVTVVIPNSGDVFDDGTGLLTGAWTDGTSSSVTGGGSGAYAGGVGACITWDTTGIVAGRRVRGRTFVVPLASGSYDTDGTLSAVVRSGILTNTATLLTAVGADLRIFSRPRPSLAGTSHPIVSARVSDRVAWLQSRKR